MSGNKRSKITRMMVIFTWYSGMDTIIASAHLSTHRVLVLGVLLLLLLVAVLLVLMLCWYWCCSLDVSPPWYTIKCKVMSPILHVWLVFGDPNSPDIFHMCFLPENCHVKVFEKQEIQIQPSRNIPGIHRDRVLTCITTGPAILP